MDRGDRRATFHGIAKELDMTELLNSGNISSFMKHLCRLSVHF